MGQYLSGSLPSGSLFSETWHTKRVSYTTNKNGKFFLKYSLPAFLEARTRFGTNNQAVFHPFKAAISQYSGLSCIKTKYASKTFYTPFALFILSYKNMQISNSLIA